MFAVRWQPANTPSTARPDKVGEEGADQTGDREGKARSEETGEKFQDTIGQTEESQEEFIGNNSETQ